MEALTLGVLGHPGAVEWACGDCRCARERERKCARKKMGNYVRKGGLVCDLDEEAINTWIDDLRDEISAQAAADNLTTRDYSATLVAALVSPSCAIVAHIGDGACVLGVEGGYKVPSWPAHGEYASTTFFVTDDQLRLEFVREEGTFDKVALFSDGLELLVLQFNSRTAFNPFFDGMFEKLKTLSPAAIERALVT